MTKSIEITLQARPKLYLQVQHRQGSMTRLSPTWLLNALRREELKRARYPYGSLQA